MEQVLLIAGLAVVAAVLAQATIAAMSSVRRLRYQGARQRLTLARLQQQIELTRASVDQRERVEQPWRGFRKFRVEKKVHEAKDICSLYLVPHDGKPIASFLPGQYLTFRLQVPDHEKPVVRCYSLSDAPDPAYYRISTKKISPPRGKPDAPPGLASSYFVETVKPGDLIDVGAPRGKFVLNPAGTASIVLIAGGIGVTPMLSMLNTLMASGSKREIWFFYGVRNSSEQIMKQHLERTAIASSNVKLHVCYSSPLDADELGHDYQHDGRVSVDLLRSLLPSNNYEFYICGPGPMMESVVSGLEEWGVPDDHVFSEAFGPASVKKVATPAAGVKSAATMSKVTFARSGKTFDWKAGDDNLLEFALANGIEIDSGCRAGDCETCITAITSGAVTYVKEPGSMPEGGSCLTCVAVPKGDLTLDA